MPDTSVKIFSSAQTGAPTLNNTAGSLIAVLDACLVNGFGVKTCDSVTIAAGVGTATISTGHSAIEDCVVLFAGATGDYTALNGERKVTSVGTNTIVFDATSLIDGTATGTITVKVAAAGWLKPFSGTNLAAYKSPNVAASGAHLYVNDTTAAYATVRGYETMTDVSTGSGMFPTVAQAPSVCWFKGDSATAKPWWIIANDRMVYFAVAPMASFPAEYVVYCFGDQVSRKQGDAYRAVLGASNTVTLARPTFQYQPIVNTATPTQAMLYCARSYTALGSPVALGRTWLDSGVSSTSGLGGRTFPNPEDNGIIFTPILTVEGTTYRGEFPGVFASPQNTTTGILDDTKLRNIPGYSRTLTYRQWGSLASGGIGGMFFDLTGPWGG